MYKKLRIGDERFLCEKRTECDMLGRCGVDPDVVQKLHVAYFVGDAF